VGNDDADVELSQNGFEVLGGGRVQILGYQTLWDTFEEYEVQS
jgi:hypothetical protein